MSVTIKQGNVGPLWRVGVPSFDADGVPIPDTLEDLSPDYECKVAVPTASTPIERAVTAKSSDDKRFLVQLAPAETELLATECHTVAIEVENPNTTPPFKIEHHVELVVEEQKITS